MKEFDRQEIYNQLLNIAEKYKDTHIYEWDDQAKEKASKLLLELCSTFPSPRVLYLETESEMSEETKKLLEDIKEKIKTKEYNSLITTELTDTLIDKKVNNTKSYFSTVRYERGTFKSLDDFSDLGQEWSEELYNYFDDTNKVQMESLLMLLNMAYELGLKEGKRQQGGLINE